MQGFLVYIMTLNVYKQVVLLWYSCRLVPFHYQAIVTQLFLLLLFYSINVTFTSLCVNRLILVSFSVV